jgi:hypothetical protein
MPGTADEPPFISAVVCDAERCVMPAVCMTRHTIGSRVDVRHWCAEHNPFGHLVEVVPDVG